MTIYCTSDLHHRHKNVIKFCDRPTTEEEHDEFIVSQLNKDINVHDTVYHLGDFTFSKDIEEIRKFCNRLNGKWIHVLGNHDDEKILREAFKGTRHNIVGSYHELKYNKMFIVMCHYPFETWNKKHYNSLHLFGHLHTMDNFNKLTYVPNRFLVSFDSNEWRAYKLEDLLKMKKDS